VPAKGVWWCDWGEEGWVFETLRQIGKAEGLMVLGEGGGDDPRKEAA
jgi:hypothetical protein